MSVSDVGGESIRYVSHWRRMRHLGQNECLGLLSSLWYARAVGGWECVCVCRWCTACSLKLIDTQIMVFINPFCSMRSHSLYLRHFFFAQNKLVKNAERADWLAVQRVRRWMCQLPPNAYRGYRRAKRWPFWTFRCSIFCCRIRIKIYDKSFADYVQS